MKALILDTETSGLIENRTINDKHLPEIIEFYACLADLTTGEILQEFDTLVKPLKSIEKLITDITHITNDMLSSAPHWGIVMSEVVTLIQSSPLVIAHNLSYDKEMIDIECERRGAKVHWPPLLCTVEQTIHIRGYRLSLTALHEYLFNEPFADAHRARPDVMALLRCSCELFARNLI